MTHAWFEPASTTSEDEWKLRCDLTAAFKLLARYGWADLIFTHVSARLPTQPNRLITKPICVLPEEVTAASLACIDVSRIDNEGATAEYALGWTMMVHQSRADANCAILLGTVHGAAASRRDRLPQMDKITREWVGEINWASDLCDLAASNAFLVPGFGTLAVGKSVPEAFMVAYFLERLCAIEATSGWAGGDSSRVAFRMGPRPTLPLKDLWSALVRSVR